MYICILSIVVIKYMYFFQYERIKGGREGRASCQGVKGGAKLMLMFKPGHQVAQAAAGLESLMQSFAKLQYDPRPYYSELHSGHGRANFGNRLTRAMSRVEHRADFLSKCFCILGCKARPRIRRPAHRAVIVSPANVACSPSQPRFWRFCGLES